MHLDKLCTEIYLRVYVESQRLDPFIFPLISLFYPSLSRLASQLHYPTLAFQISCCK